MTLALKPLRLDIGASHLRVHEGYTTVDLYAPEADVQADMGALPYETGSVDEIWASHCLEHVPAARTAEVLAEWLRVLAPGRPAIISVPNMDYAARYWLHGPDRDAARQMFWGHQEEPGEVHLQGFGPASFRAALEAAGFEITSFEIIWETQDNTTGSYVHDMETIRAEVQKPGHIH